MRIPRDRFSVGVVLASLLYLLALMLCYLLRPDGAAAVTVLPAWAWAAPGVVVLGLGWRVGRRVLGVALLGWVAFLLWIPDESVALWHALRPLPASSLPRLRVVSLNCGGGDPLAAAEVAAFHPDLVFLQETPAASAVQALARTVFPGRGTALVGLDAAIISAGPLTPITLTSLSRRARAALACATVTLPNGLACDVLDLRLLPPLVRMDYWSPDCWRAQRENRQDRRAQLQAIIRAYQQQRPGHPLILGGDFNAPGGDAACRVLKPALRDAFAAAGVGWGNTHENGFPIVRIDQLWATPAIRPLRVFVRKTQHSDHRMVIADFLLTSPER
ncbi:MAG TPA: endonuclease/exonuclease/phosphatase family protein, partial [Armatimonadota bacterium]